MPRARPRPLENDTDIEGSEARFRFKWIERDIVDIKTAHKELFDKVDGIDKSLTKINRNVLIAASIILGAGIGSRLFSSDVVELIKKLAGF